MIIDILLPVSLIFIMFSLGISLTVNDFRSIANDPKAFSLGIVIQMILLPIITFCIISIFNLDNQMAVGMMILSCCPGGVTSNIITKLANGDTALSISYTAIISIASVITLPAIVSYSIIHFMETNAPSINIFTLGLSMFIITTIPVLFGLYINTKFNDVAQAFASIANKISTILFIIIVFGALASEWETFINNVFSLGPAILTLIASMMIIGYNSPRLFGIGRKRSITIAIESGIQNATVGITIGNLILSQSSGISQLSLPSGVYGILMYIVCLPSIFLFFRKK